MNRPSSAPIVIRYRAVDGYSQVRKFYSLAPARQYAYERVGPNPEFGTGCACAPDGVGVIDVEGVALADLFPAPVAAPAPLAERGTVVGRHRDGSPIHVFEDGSDDYHGEDDETERAIENRNDEYASRQTAIDAFYGV